MRIGLYTGSHQTLFFKFSGSSDGSPVDSDDGAMAAPAGGASSSDHPGK